jgi:hypothetical protein
MNSRIAHNAEVIQKGRGVLVDEFPVAQHSYNGH